MKGVPSISGGDLRVFDVHLVGNDRNGRIVFNDSISIGGFGFVQSRVCLSNEFFNVAAVIRVGRDTHANCDPRKRLKFKSSNALSESVGKRTQLADRLALRMATPARGCNPRDSPLV